MQFLSKSFLLLSVLLLSSFGHATNSLKVKTWQAYNCPSTDFTTATVDAGSCVAKSNGFESYKIASGTIQDGNGCTLNVYSDGTCTHVLGVGLSLKPATVYPSDCYNVVNGGVSTTAYGLKLVCA